MSACNFPKSQSKQDAEIIESLNELFLQHINLFEMQLVDFKAAATSKNSEDLHSFFENSYLAFQNFGFLLDYFDSDLYSIFNGAPIAKEDDGNPYPNVVPPNGLQVIFEGLENPMANATELKQQLDFLINQLRFVRDIAANNNLTPSIIYQAIAKYTIRFETLSLAGFDQSTQQNEYAFLANELDALNHYLSLASINQNFIQISYDSTLVTNKLQFLKEKLYPFKAKLWERTEKKQTISPIRDQYANIYDPQFLNASFFSKNGMVEKPSEVKLTLGKLLFNDPLLSNDAVSLSCASCHLTNRFFMDGLKLGKSNLPGFELMRNTPTLIHVAYQSKFMYDGRANSLEEQMLHVFRNEKEFKSNVSDIIAAIATNDDYLQRFAAIYPEMAPNIINIPSITDALATYVRSLDGHQSTFDQYMRDEIKVLDTAAMNGFNLFMGKAKCGTCHFAPTFSGLLPPLFVDTEFENIGVPGAIDNGKWDIDKDLGRFQFYSNEALMHFFKTTSVRNVAHTAPYMHNGVFTTLEEVLAFYNHGGGVGHGLEYVNQSLPANSLQLTELEMQEIIAFIKTLTDERYLTD